MMRKLIELQDKPLTIRYYAKISRRIESTRTKTIGALEKGLLFWKK